MAVSFDTTFEKGFVAQASPASFISNAGTVAGTVGSNANRVLIGIVGFRAEIAAVGTVTMTWNSVSMTLIGSGNDSINSDCLFVFGLINPATGNQTLAVSWTGGNSPDVSLGAVSIFNADQATGWRNFTSASGTSTAPSVSVTSANGNMVVAGRVDDNASTPRTVSVGTLDWDEGALNGNYGGAHNPSSGTPTAITWSSGSRGTWFMGGVDILVSVLEPDEIEAGRGFLSRP